ncbi:MAG: thioredoxin domain-containing protein, partial [Candidatus Hydrogenedentes bacterium]|nr:thioredoxin domain-containing protein [Candidatus Hydrogenedentota bacterium]
MPTDDPKPVYINHLIHETSPYLLQHAHNPVEWYPWGDEAIEKAREEDKPIFLSIGYSACHWCHVMEHESFENAAVGEFLAEHFISIKVDREERPDLDDIYMTAVIGLNGQGGWPMSVFLTPDLEPFYGGTYYPPEDRGGHPGFKTILQGIAHSWQVKREEISRGAANITTYLNEQSGKPLSDKVVM